MFLKCCGFSSKSVEFFEVVSSCSKLCQFGLSYFPLFQLLFFIHFVSGCFG